MQKIELLAKLTFVEFLKRPFATIAFVAIVAIVYLFIFLDKKNEQLHTQIALLNLEKVECERKAVEREIEIRKEFSKNYNDVLEMLLDKNKQQKSK